MLIPMHTMFTRAKGITHLAIVFLLLNISAIAQSGKDLVQPIMSALQNNEFAKALALLQPALQAYPGNPQLWMLQGLAYAWTGDRRLALASYEHVLKIAPEYLPALEGAAQLEYEAASPEAIPLLERVLRLRSQDTTAHAMLATLAARKGDCETAVTHFALSGQALISQPAALREYGVCLMKLKRPEKAAQVFQELLASHPDDVSARRSLAALQLNANQPKDALATLQPLLDSTPDTSTLRLAAAIYEANNDTPNAVRMLRDAIVKAPLEVPLYVDFAEIAMNHQSFQAGIEMINSGLKLQPNAAELYVARGVLYVQLADYERAEEDFERAEQLDPNRGLSAAAQGMLAEEKDQNDPDRALATIKAKLVKNPGDPFLWYLQAAVISQKSPEPGSAEFEQGMDSAKRAVTLNPSLTAAHNVLAKFYLDSGQTELAVRECRLALQQSPEDQTALYRLVLALRKSKDQTEIPDLLKRLAKARQNAAREEAERNRYKLVVVPAEINQ
jgi:tetratricopeptide (TPR) repeat protein